MTQSVLHRLTNSVIAVVVATTALVAGGSGPARAASTWQLSDTMENGATLAQDRFFFETDSPYAEGHIQTAGGISYHARSGTQAAMLRNTWVGGSWVSVGKNVRILPRAYGFQTSCHFMAWVYGSGTATYNIEVIDPATWKYLSVKRVTQPVAWTWSKISTAEFGVSYPNAVLRVSYLLPGYGSAVFVDDFGLVCSY